MNFSISPVIRCPVNGQPLITSCAQAQTVLNGSLSTPLKGFKVNVFFEIQDLQLQFQMAFEDQFGRSDEVNFLKCAYLTGR
jgi:hypothetical protein